MLQTFFSLAFYAMVFLDCVLPSILVIENTALRQYNLIITTSGLIPLKDTDIPILYLG